ncbi:MAG: polyphosphate kinase 1 [Deltaproteobacteria bacterium]|nr:polyphosphate kinase 1 [Deltaproteobacteria bacterium]
MEERLYTNRELSWLEFNRRVLHEALDESVPVLERVKFLSIFSSNLDEFFMVRVARLKQRIAAGDQQTAPDGLSPQQTLAAVAERVHRLAEQQHRCFLEDLQPRLAVEGIRIVSPADLTEEQKRFLHDYFQRTLYPIVTPLAIDPGHPFPHLANRALCLVASLRRSRPSHLPNTSLSVVHLPAQAVPRFIALPASPGAHVFILLEDVIHLNLSELYRGYDVLSCHAVRVTRDGDTNMQIPLVRNQDLLTAIEQSVRDRRMGTAVRLQYDDDIPPEVLTNLVSELELQSEDLYPGKGFTAFADLFQLYTAVDIPRLKDRPQPSLPVPAFETTPDVWSAIRNNDILVHHPYQSFRAVTRFLEEAADDPKVLAIKMTLYRVGPASPIPQILARAAENGKEVAVLLELRARFDEEANISWARALEEVGAHVVYGIVGYKTHCKACMVVRQEADGLRRYCHLATGNYNVRTSTIYGDLGLFTCRESFGEDLTELFNLMTGYAHPRESHHLLVSPFDLRDGIVRRIQQETAHAQAGRPAHIIAKMNGLEDPIVIDELYTASQAGVQIDLIVRGLCCLRPGIPGVSDNIRIISIVDRYLEHARIFYFHNAGEPEYWLASSDWMPRNLDNRIEVAFPIIDPRLQAQIRKVLDIQLSDSVKAHQILPDGGSERLTSTTGVPLRSQERLYELYASSQLSLSFFTPQPTLHAGKS